MDRQGIGLDGLPFSERPPTLGTVPTAGGEGMDAMASERRRGHPIFAALYDPINRMGERKLLGPLRQHIAGEAVGRVLEIGAGTGANFPFYRNIAPLVATEPDPFMLRRAKQRAREVGLPVEFHDRPAEALPFADASFDTVVATLVLCSVADPARALAEVRRVLKPDGTFRFIEHVRAHSARTARVQDFLTPVWRRLAAGCHPNRRTAEAIAGAGLPIIELQERMVPMQLLIAGVARRGEGGVPTTSASPDRLSVGSP